MEKDPDTVTYRRMKREELDHAIHGLTPIGADARDRFMAICFHIHAQDDELERVAEQRDAYRDEIDDLKNA